MGCCKHGHAGRQPDGRKESPTYTSWRCMMERCYRKDHPSYPMYGAEGIQVDKRWHDFSNFLEDMGERPDGHTLGRITPFSDYGPGECEWQDIYTQNRAEARPTDCIEVDGKKRSRASWAKYLGIEYQTLNKRLQRGWGLDAFRIHCGKRRTTTV